MTNDEWGDADVVVERLRVALMRLCGINPKSVIWSYGGSSGEKSTVRITIRLDVPQGFAVADKLAGHHQAPRRS